MAGGGVSDDGWFGGDTILYLGEMSLRPFLGVRGLGTADPPKIMEIDGVRGGVGGVVGWWGGGVVGLGGVSNCTT